MAVANILRSCMLTRPSCTQGFCPSCPGALQYACSYISNFPSFVTSNKSTVAAVTRKRVLLVSSFCTNVDATSSVTSPSSTAPTLATPVTGTKEGTLSSSINPVASNDQIKDAANMLDIRVGCILKAWKHEEAESLYVEEVDVGEPEPRIICSGLVNYIPLDQLQGKKVVVLANLKPRNMRGIKSCGMLMAASDASHENVELLMPSDDSIPGERIWFGTEDERECQPVAATPNQIQKKKIWELVQPHLKTDSSCVAALGEHFMRTLAGFVICKSLKNANIS